MAKTAKKIALFTDKIDRLIAKGLITEEDIIDKDVKTEHENRKKIKA